MAENGHGVINYWGDQVLGRALYQNTGADWLAFRLF